MKVKRILLLLAVVCLLAGLAGCDLGGTRSSVTNTPIVENEAAEEAVLQAEKLSAADVAADPVSVILGRPTDNEVTASILTNTAAEVYVEWGEKSGAYARKSETLACDGTTPAVFVLDELAEDARSYYRVSWKAEGEEAFTPLEEASVSDSACVGGDVPLYDSVRFASEKQSERRPLRAVDGEYGGSSAGLHV